MYRRSPPSQRENLCDGGIHGLSGRLISLLRDHRYNVERAGTGVGVGADRRKGTETGTEIGAGAGIGTDRRTGEGSVLDQVLE